jgi:hypothetical protein
LYVAAVIVGFVAFVGIGVAQNQPTTTGRSGGSSGSRAVRSTRPDVSIWAAGQCVWGDGMYYPVSCTGKHDGRILQSVVSPLMCPFGTDEYVQFASTYHCIDTDG